MPLKKVITDIIKVIIRIILSGVIRVVDGE